MAGPAGLGRRGRKGGVRVPSRSNDSFHVRNSVTQAVQATALEARKAAEQALRDAKAQQEMQARLNETLDGHDERADELAEADLSDQRLDESNEATGSLLKPASSLAVFAHALAADPALSEEDAALEQALQAAQRRVNGRKAANSPALDSAPMFQSPAGPEGAPVEKNYPNAQEGGPALPSVFSRFIAAVVSAMTFAAKKFFGAGKEGSTFQSGPSSPVSSNPVSDAASSVVPAHHVSNDLYESGPSHNGTRGANPLYERPLMRPNPLYADSKEGLISNADSQSRQMQTWEKLRTPAPGATPVPSSPTKQEERQTSHLVEEKRVTYSVPLDTGTDLVNPAKPSSTPSSSFRP